jgi:hypothetical protein
MECQLDNSVALIARIQYDVHEKEQRHRRLLHTRKNEVAAIREESKSYLIRIYCKRILKKDHQETFFHQREPIVHYC